VQQFNSEQEIMSLAIAKAREGIAAGQSPFGAIIVRGSLMVAATHNTVWRDTDPTAHAEVNCIRSAASAFKVIDLLTVIWPVRLEVCRSCVQPEGVLQ
jgi:guanine deaminase